MGIDAEGRAHPVQQFGAERLAAGQHAAQFHAGMFHLRLPHQLQRGRRQEHVADGVIGHQLHRRLRLELFGAVPDHGHAVIPGRKQRIEQSADPGPVRGRPHHVEGFRHEIMHHLDVRQVTEQHAMGVQGAFRISGGAGGVDDDGGIVGRGIDGGKFFRRGLDRRPERSGARRGRLADHIDILQLRQPVADFCQFFPAGFVGHDRPGAGIGEAIFQRILAEQREQRHRHQAGAECGKVSDRQLQRLRQKRRDAVAANEPIGLQHIGKRARHRSAARRTRCAWCRRPRRHRSAPAGPSRRHGDRSRRSRY